MQGTRVQLQISPNATILELKRRIQANNEIGNFEIYRQRLMYRLGQYGMNPLADNLTLRQCDIGQIAGDEIEVDLLLDENLLEFSPEVRERVFGLLRNRRTDELTKLLSQYVGTLEISYLGLEPYNRHWIVFDPATRWLNTLANALRENTTVTHLFIQGKRFLDEDFTALAEALVENTHITHLSLLEMNIGDNHMSALAYALKVNRNITNINLAGNIIGDAGVIALADALKSNNTITHINLHTNEFGDSGIVEFAKVLRLRQNIRITNIDFRWLNITKVGLVALRELRAARPELIIEYNDPTASFGW
jgi:hypothetical protein